MKNNRAALRRGSVRAFCILAAALVLCVCTGAFAVDDSELVLITPELILARDAAVRMNLKGPDGNTLQVRSSPNTPGRGNADAEGKAPEYIGEIGFAALPNDPEMSKFSVFDKAYWVVPEYELREGNLVQTGSIPHKTPVVVTEQKLEPDGNGNYTGLLRVVRLDVARECVIDASCFVTLPYWSLPIREVSEYGCCIAVYRETPGEGPRDENGNAFVIRDGTRVLIPFDNGESTNSLSDAVLNVQGVVFREAEDGTVAPVNVSFREADLILNY